MFKKFNKNFYSLGSIQKAAEAFKGVASLRIKNEKKYFVVERREKQGIADLDVLDELANFALVFEMEKKAKIY